jgi:hypothetical protein
MISQHRTRVGLAAALAVASLAAAAPAGADSHPAQRVQSSSIAGALAQERYYMSHKPAIPGPGHDFGTGSIAGALAHGTNEQDYTSHEHAIPAPGHDLRTIDARDAADATGGAVTHNTAPVTAQPASSTGFEWGDAAIGAGSALGLALVFAGGAAAITRRHRGATGNAATS